MPDEQIIATETPAAPSVASPPVASPEPSVPVVDATEPTPTPVENTVEKPVEPPKEKSLLGAEPPKDEVKAPEVKPADEKPVDAPVEPQKEDGKQSDEPAPLPTYEAFTLPEGYSLEGERLSDFTKELAEFETTNKADHAKVQEFGQKLVDRHIAEVQTAIQRLNEHYSNTWEQQKNDWKESFLKDPEIGGNRHETTLNAALQFIRTHGGNDAQQQEFRQLMDTTGIGNHPAMIRLLAKASIAMSEGKPLPATAPESRPTSKVAKRYGGSV